MLLIFLLCEQLVHCSNAVIFADVIAPAVHLVVSPELTLLCCVFLGDSGNAKLRLRTAAPSVRKATKKKPEKTQHMRTH